MYQVIIGTNLVNNRAILTKYQGEVPREKIRIRQIPNTRSTAITRSKLSGS